MKCHFYVLWWAHLYDTVTSILHGSGLLPRLLHKRRGLAHIIDRLLVPSLTHPTHSHSHSPPAAPAPTLSPFTLPREDKSEVREFYEPHFLDLFSVRNGLAPEYTQQLLPSVCILVSVVYCE